MFCDTDDLSVEVIVCISCCDAPLMRDMSVRLPFSYRKQISSNDSFGYGSGCVEPDKPYFLNKLITGCIGDNVQGVLRTH